jgi:hypothetical protein
MRVGTPCDLSNNKGQVNRCWLPGPLSFSSSAVVGAGGRSVYVARCAARFGGVGHPGTALAGSAFSSA